MKKEYYTVQEVADLLKVHVGSVRRFISKNKLVSVKVGRAVRVEQSAIDDFLRKKGA